jgi:hypothetical protein
MAHGPSEVVTNHLAAQYITHNSWNPKIHYPRHKSSPLVSILSQINLISVIPLDVQWDAIPAATASSVATGFGHC